MSSKSIRQIVEKAIEYNKPAFMCFVDLKKAFDRVKLSDVINILVEKKVPAKGLNIIEDLYTDTTTEVQVGNELSAKIKCVGGIRLGDSFSPAMFNGIMDKLIDSTKIISWYKVNARQIRIVYYGDDAVLIADSEDNLQRDSFINS